MALQKILEHCVLFGVGESALQKAISSIPCCVKGYKGTINNFRAIHFVQGGVKGITKKSRAFRFVRGGKRTLQKHLKYSVLFGRGGGKKTL
jgi:hypothetical protein